MTILALSLLFSTLLPFPNPYLYLLDLWQQVLLVSAAMIALQALYMFPFPTPYLQEARIVNRILNILILLLFMSALIASIWGTIAQIAWLTRAVTYAMVLCVFGSILILIRRWQGEGKPSGLSLGSPRRFMLALTVIITPCVDGWIALLGV